jgi:tetratricopeptide (TPR) repeat protein
MGAARAHVSDMDELLRLIENCITNCDPPPEPVDEREGLLDAYKQMLKYFLHETEELTKCNKDENGNTKLGKAAMLKIAQIGNAVHLLGASFGGYGFFDEEIRYYRKALELKTLAANGNIEKSVSASDTLHSMGFSLDNSGKRDEALKCYNQALDIRYACLGNDDLRVAETQHNKVTSCELCGSTVW